MNIEEFREYCLSLPSTSEALPFDETSLVFKVGRKMFALTVLEGPFWINLKCDPAKAIELREQYQAVRPGYHMNKKHWNTIEVDGSVSNALIRQWTKESYELVIKGMTRKERESINR
ncbi:MmcQ/YjbR family DNA-binding protein [Marinilabilia salmonicolor]|uniref:MmcQ/YjbR family DNA-binding protein n=1 Tax=Marinilabilia salmonicolor TaxID=989 RepID=UPI00029A5189|nr:MmcQ/YjbR family DNA-binding protein [Marinilabilia salmonicolor]